MTLAQRLVDPTFWKMRPQQRMLEFPIDEAVPFGGLGSEELTDHRAATIVVMVPVALPGVDRGKKRGVDRGRTRQCSRCPCESD